MATKAIMAIETDKEVPVCIKCGSTEKLNETETSKKMCLDCNFERIGKLIDEFTSNTEYERNPLCPNCGYVYSDAWELDDFEEELECGRCGMGFECLREVTIEYNTYKKEGWKHDKRNIYWW